MDESLKNVQAISKLYTDDQKTKYSSNPNDSLKSAKSFYENLYTKETTSKTATSDFFKQNS